MPLLEFGTAAGLAAQNDFQAHDAQRLELLKLERSLRIDQETRTKMQADDYKLPEMGNEYDTPRAMKIAEAKLKEASKFELDNPDWSVNVEKRRQRDQLLHEATNNPYVYRLMRFKDSEKTLRDYIASNPGAQNDPEIIQQLQEIQNYKSHQGPQDPEEYIFRSPENEEKMFAALQDAASKAGMHGVEDYRDGFGSARQFVTSTDKMEATAAFAQSPQADHWRRKWNRTDKSQPFEEWLTAKMNPYFPADKIQPGKFFKQGGGGSGSGGSGSGMVSPYHELLIKATQSENEPIEAPPEAVQKLFRTNDGYYNIDNTVMFNEQTGESYPVQGGVIKSATTAGSTIKFVPNGNGNGGKFYAKIKIFMPVKDFEQRVFKGADVIDLSNTPWTNAEVEKQFAGFPIKITLDEKGKQRMVETEVWKAIDPLNTAQAATFNAAVNGKTEAFNSSAAQNPGIHRAQGPNGEIIYSQDGENWVDETGNPIQ